MHTILEKSKFFPVSTLFLNFFVILCHRGQRHEPQSGHQHRRIRLRPAGKPPPAPPGFRQTGRDLSPGSIAPAGSAFAPAQDSRSTPGSGGGIPARLSPICSAPASVTQIAGRGTPLVQCPRPVSREISARSMLTAPPGPEGTKGYWGFARRGRREAPLNRPQHPSGGVAISTAPGPVPMPSQNQVKPTFPSRRTRSTGPRFPLRPVGPDGYPRLIQGLRSRHRRPAGPKGPGGSLPGN